MEFPYIKQIHVNNCYTFQNFDVPLKPLNDFKHIIFTGKNGTGKTTILNRIAFQLNEFRTNGRDKINGLKYLNNVILSNHNHPSLKNWKQNIVEYNALDLFFLDNENLNLLTQPNDYIFSFFKAHRKVNLQDVNTVSKENLFLIQLDKQNDPDKFVAQFKQYLVNKKVYEAFDYMNSKTESINQNKIFFDKLKTILRNILGDKQLYLEFVQENFEFYINFSDGRSITFNQLSEGFSAFISILMDLLMRVDLIRKNISDFNYDPFGIVLIDEPETHFHIEMQYEILPLLTELFPKIQFIIATHSPAIISSITNAIVYDLSSRKEILGRQVGSSYSELMVKHFGLDNEFSPIADEIIKKINYAVINNNIELLRKIILENEEYLTASLKFEIENQIIAIESKKE